MHSLQCASLTSMNAMTPRRIMESIVATADTRRYSPSLDGSAKWDGGGWVSAALSAFIVGAGHSVCSDGNDALTFGGVFFGHAAVE